MHTHTHTRIHVAYPYPGYPISRFHPASSFLISFFLSPRSYLSRAWGSWWSGRRDNGRDDIDDEENGAVQYHLTVRSILSCISWHRLYGRPATRGDRVDLGGGREKTGLRRDGRFPNGVWSFSFRIFSFLPLPNPLFAPQPASFIPCRPSSTRGVPPLYRIERKKKSPYYVFSCSSRWPR